MKSVPTPSTPPQRRLGARRSAALRITLATTLALALGAVVAPSAWAAPDPGYAGAPRNADGSLDFSAWTAVPSPSSGAQLGDYQFTRNGITYDVSVNRPQYVENLLVANVIRAQSVGHTYSFSLGSASTSFLYYLSAGDTTATPLSAANPAYFMTPTSNGVAVARTATTTANGTTLSFSEVLDVTDEGRLVHHLTLTNPGTGNFGPASFYAELDTMLDSNDNIPIKKAHLDSVYIDNGAMRLYLGLLDGDAMLAGDWIRRASPNTYLSVNAGYATDDEIIAHADTAVIHMLNNRTIPANSSITLTWEERLYDVLEITQIVNVVYVDAGGNTVAPKPGTTVQFSGDALTPVGFTEAMARAGVPDGYYFDSFANVTTFDDDSSVDQTITVNVRQVPTARVEYVDDEAGGAIVAAQPGTTTVFYGVVGDPIGFTQVMAEAGVPTNYVFVSLDNVAIFDGDDTTDQVIRVHLSHVHVPGTLVTTRTIHYEGAGALTPADVVQTINWTTDADLATGVTTYTTTESYAALVSPLIEGFTARQATVAVLNFPAPVTTTPQNTVVTVAYAPPLPATGSDAALLVVWGGAALMFIMSGVLFVSRRRLISLG